jgi:hypothetical protein
MAIKDLIANGIGFTPGSVKFIITRGLGIAVPPSAKGKTTVKVLNQTTTMKILDRSHVVRVL